MFLTLNQVKLTSVCSVVTEVLFSHLYLSYFLGKNQLGQAKMTHFRIGFAMVLIYHLHNVCVFMFNKHFFFEICTL